MDFPAITRTQQVEKPFGQAKKTVDLALIAFISGLYQKAADAQHKIILGPVYCS